MIKSFYTNNTFYACLGVIITLFVFGFFFPLLYWVAWGAFVLFLVVACIDMMLLSTLGKVIANRIVPEKFSNGDENKISITIENLFPFTIHTTIIDEIPFQFQKRDFNIERKIIAKQKDSFTYQLTPNERGIYQFGKLNVFVKTPITLFSKRFTFADKVEVPTYPSFLKLRKYQWIATNAQSAYLGFKKIRRAGNSTEFEQIKEYVNGDDIKHINWKATAKRSQLMVNQYQEEKSQNIYLIIDKGRVMRMPFHNMRLLDYAVNASMNMAHVILKKYDKAGLITFSKKVDTLLKADQKTNQLVRFSEQLFALETDFKESDYGMLYNTLNHKIKHRSLLILFTNFETIEALNRQLPYIQRLAKKHVVLTVFFENTELEEFVIDEAKDVRNLYHKISAQKFIFEKKLIVQKLHQHGINALLTKPEDLTIDTINKYLEIKSRGII